MQKPVLACLDLEGVLVPEIWINVALKTGIEELKVTTREMPDYDALMKRRLAILAQHNLTIADIQENVSSWRRPNIEAALEYEKANANRKGAVAALEAALAEKESS